MDGSTKVAIRASVGLDGERRLPDGALVLGAQGRIVGVEPGPVPT